MLERRPWGWFIVLARLPFAWVKVIRVREGHRTSLQWHALRSEYWLCLTSGGVAMVGHAVWETFALLPLAVRRGQWHRLCGPLLALEVAWGLPKEGDISRVDDDYGRV